MYDAKAYGMWQHSNRRAYAESFASNIEELKPEGKYRILSSEQALESIKKNRSIAFFSTYWRGYYRRWMKELALI